MRTKNSYSRLAVACLVLGLGMPAVQGLAEQPLGPLGVVGISLLSPEDISRLEIIEAAVSETARQLRTQLRALRMQSGFNSAHLFKIERYMGKVQANLRRMLKHARGETQVAMPWRILLDDLARQLDGLRQERIALIETSRGGAADKELLDSLAHYIGRVAEALEVGQHALH